MERREYIQKLKEYTKIQGISIYDYYYNYAKLLRSNDKFVLQLFELRNPFLTSEDIKKLVFSKEDRIEEYFADIMTKLISYQVLLLSKEEIREVIDESLDKNISREDITEVVDTKLNQQTSLPRKEVEEVIEESLETTISRDDIESAIEETFEQQPKLKVFLTSIGRKLADVLNGFAVIKEEKTGRVHLYYHDAKKDSLTKESIAYNNHLKVETGYYVNFQEYVDSLLDEIISKYPNPEEIRFIREDGVERSLNELLEEAFAILNKHGALRFGKAISGKTITSYKDLRELNANQMDNYKGESLQTGIYVRRDILTRIMAKYKAKVTAKEEIEKKTTK